MLSDEDVGTAADENAAPASASGARNVKVDGDAVGTVIVTGDNHVHGRGDSAALADGGADLLSIHRRRLQKLKEQAAYTGVSAPPEVLMEIEDLEKKIAELERS